MTLTGPGGVGKTQLALAVAHRLLGDFPDGLFVVELEAVRDPAGVPARSLGARARRRDWGRAAAAARRSPSRASHAARARQLRTPPRGRRGRGGADRACRGTAARHEPGPAPRGGRAASSRCAHWRCRTAARRICARSPRCPRSHCSCSRPSASIRDIDITHENAPAIAELCAQLDGLPLGLELAAPASPLLSPAQLLERLVEGLDALGRGGRDLPARQSGLHAALDWTTRLLAPASHPAHPTRRLRRRLHAHPRRGGRRRRGHRRPGRPARPVIGPPRRAGRLSMPPPVASLRARDAVHSDAARSAHAHHAEAILELVEPISADG